MIFYARQHVVLSTY